MAWTSPMTASLNGTLTAANWNTHVRDNMLETEVAKLTDVSEYLVTNGANKLVARKATRATVTTEQTTASTSYVNLGTLGPSVTVTTGTLALVFGHCLGAVSGSSNAWFASWSISGATSVSSSDTWAVMDKDAINAARAMVFLHTLTAGSNTFKMTYRVDGGTGTFRYRRITVLPLS